MKDSLTSRNHQDFRQRYGGTFGWLLKPNGEKFLVFVDTSDQHAVHFSEGNGENNIYHAKVDAGVEFEFIPVNRGWFNSTDGKTYFLERIPARQWRRGICEANTALYKIDSIGWKDRITYNILATIFHPGWDNWNVVDWNKPPYAISQHFAIDSRKNVYFYHAQVGRLEGNNIILRDDFVYQELSDVLRRKNSPIKVVINE